MAQASHNLLLKRKNGNSKIKCDGCGKIKRVRHIIQFKGKFLCNICINNLPQNRIQQSATQILSGCNKKTMEQALSKIYLFKGYYQKGIYEKCAMAFPTILIGHKIKLVLADEEMDNDRKN